MNMDEVNRMFQCSPLMVLVRELEQAESIIHALCDERASRRSHHRAMATVLRSYLREPSAKPAPRILPVGHVPERLMVGMLVSNGSGWHGCIGPLETGANLYKWYITTPFEVPND